MNRDSADIRVDDQRVSGSHGQDAAASFPRNATKFAPKVVWYPVTTSRNAGSRSTARRAAGGASRRSSAEARVTGRGHRSTRTTTKPPDVETPATAGRSTRRANGAADATAEATDELALE